MTGKAKPKKHTAKEIAAKVDAATTNRGGGKAGQADRTGLDKGGHAKLECPLCKVTAPDVKSMQIHHEARHPKIPFDETKINNLHATVAPDTSKPKPGIRGSLKNWTVASFCRDDVVTDILKANIFPWVHGSNVIDTQGSSLISLSIL